MLIFNQVCKEELRDLTFNIKRNEFVFFYIDQEKKLQILRELITGTIKPDSGIIKWLNNEQLLKDDLGVVFKENILLPDRSLQENMRFIMEVKGLNRRYFKNRFFKILKTVELFEYQNCKVDELLYHQLVRANIMQALLNYPAILLLEDLTKEMDEINSRAIFHLLEKINDLSITIIYLSTEKDSVLHSQKRVIRLDEDRIMKSGKGY